MRPGVAALACLVAFLVATPAHGTPTRDAAGLAPLERALDRLEHDTRQLLGSTTDLEETELAPAFRALGKRLDGSLRMFTFLAMLPSDYKGKHTAAKPTASVKAIKTVVVHEVGEITRDMGSLPSQHQDLVALYMDMLDVRRAIWLNLASSLGSSFLAMKANTIVEFYKVSLDSVLRSQPHVPSHVPLRNATHTTLSYLGLGGCAKSSLFDDFECYCPPDRAVLLEIDETMRLLMQRVEGMFPRRTRFCPLREAKRQRVREIVEKNIGKHSRPRTWSDSLSSFVMSGGVQANVPTAMALKNLVVATMQGIRGLYDWCFAFYNIQRLVTKLAETVNAPFATCHDLVAMATA